MKKVFVVIALLTSFTAKAEWTTVGWSNGDLNKPGVAIDYENSFNSNGIQNIWWKYWIPEFTMVSRPKLHPMNVHRSQIDCRSRMIKNDYVQQYEVLSFNDPNPQIYQEPYYGPGAWYVPQLNSSDEFVVKIVCNLFNK